MKTASRRTAVIACFVIALPVILIPSLANAADGPEVPKTEAPPVALRNEDAKYGDADYASSPAEEADLGLVAVLEKQLGAVGLYRAGGTSMVLRLPAETRLPSLRETVGRFTVSFETSAFTKASLAAALKTVTTVIRETNNSSSSWSFSYNPESDHIEAAGAIPAEAVEILKSVPNVTVTTGKGMEAQTRGSDQSPHWGGAVMTNGLYNKLCSTGFPVIGGSGTQYMVTAAHCFPLGTNVFSPDDTNYYTEAGINTDQIGEIVRYENRERDIALIGDDTYAAAVYMGNKTGTGYPISSGRDPLVGDVLCVSGISTYQNCGKKVVSLQTTATYGGQVKEHLADYVGGKPTLGGDSGGPVVNLGASTVGIRASHLAYNSTSDHMVGTRVETLAVVFPGMKVKEQ
jgi:hypothetical protein